MAQNFEDLLTGQGSEAKKENVTSIPSIDDAKRDTYTDEELRDVNNITVTIPDNEAPIVVFFGSQASGKTLALLRMIRYLEGQGKKYTIEPERVFRPKTDKHYTQMCNNLKTMAYNQYAPGGNDVISFMLVKVLDEGGNVLCQLLEAPGEHYFDGTDSINFPTYINKICNVENRKIWVFFVEQDWGDDATIRGMYAQKICKMQEMIMPQDKVVFLFNKCDKKRGTQYLPNKHPNVEVFFDNIKKQYPNIFARYTRSGFSAFLFGKYDFDMVCFSAGTFNKAENGREVWTPSLNFYCEDLWRAIN